MTVIPLPYNRDGQYYCDRLARLAGFVWLDSGTLDADQARYDILSALPTRTVSGSDCDSIRASVNLAISHFDTSGSDLPFCGGWIGYLSYEARHAQFKLPQRNTYTCPNARFAWYDCAVVQDHLLKNTCLVVTQQCPDDIRQSILQSLHASPAQEGAYQCGQFQTDQPKSRYLSDLAVIKEYLVAGDCYQTNYTQRFSASFAGDPLAAYRALRRAVPSPFAAYIALPSGESILSISPERFIRVAGCHALTQPIKGTAPRDADPAKDQQLRSSLAASEKNRAENLMIVDLLRNDFNQSCLPHSVRVPKLFEPQTFANVHHLVSTIEGTLPPGRNHFDFILSCFPGGSITGAPKKRAMEIIEELEAHGRGIYCGAIGYLSANGNSDFNIAIRSFYVQEGRIFCWAGGGIVADSEPELEYQESLHKIGALMRALSGATAPG